MTNFSTYLELDNEIKIDELLKNGELLDGYAENDNMVYHFLLNDFFVTMITSEVANESIMRVSRSSAVIDQHLDSINIEDLY
jgi:hypothetical protein